MPNGSIYPCEKFSSLNDFKLGDVFNGLNKNIKVFNDYTREKHNCKNCKIFNTCKNECFYYNYIFTGNILKPTKFNCQVEKALNYIYLKKLVK